MCQLRRGTLQLGCHLGKLLRLCLHELLQRGIFFVVRLGLPRGRDHLFQRLEHDANNLLVDREEGLVGFEIGPLGVVSKELLDDRFEYRIGTVVYFKDYSRLSIV